MAFAAASDSVLRAITNDGAFRVVVTKTTDTVRGAVAAQHGSGETVRHFGELLTGSILFRETMAPQLRVQSIVRGAGGVGSLVADSHPSGMTRGLIQLPRGGEEVSMAAGALLQFMRTLPGGRINQGVVEMPPHGGISRALMVYMQTSEQVVSMLAVGTVVEGDDVVSAGGYLVQLLPEVGRGPLMVMTERLRDFESIDAQLRDERFSPAWLLDQLLYGMEYTRLEESSVGFECWCNELRLLSALATLPRNDIEELVAEGELLEISCDYCGREYRIPPAKLTGLLDAS
jgi:molecular chaperone Hsp33